MEMLFKNWTLDFWHFIKNNIIRINKKIKKKKICLNWVHFGMFERNIDKKIRSKNNLIEKHSD